MLYIVTYYQVRFMLSCSDLVLELIEVDIFKIKPSINFYGSKRKETNDLLSSIKENGLLQPIIIRTKGKYFEIVTGNRRFNACKALGWRKIICHLVEVDDKKAFEISITENIQRKSLDPIEEAKAFNLYVDDFGWGGITDLSLKIGKSPSYIYKRLSLLTLPANLIRKIENSIIKASVAEELLFVKDEKQRDIILKMVIDRKLSSRKTRDLIKNVKYQKIISDDSLSTCFGPIYKDKIIDIDLKTQRSFDKSITALRIAMNKIANIIEGIEDNWIVYETLIHHKNMLNNQIDLLVKEKKKL